jgi:hypothetical protein
MADVDTSMYARIGQGSPNLLGPLADLSRIQLMQNQNALFQRDFAAKRALGEIAKLTTGPDGKTDWNKFLMHTAGDPRTGYMTLDVAKQVADRNLVDATAMKEAFQTGQMKQGAIGSAMLAAMERIPDNDDKADMKPVINSIGNIWGLKDQNDNPLISDKEAISRLTELGQQNMTNRQLRDYLHQHGTASIHISQQLDRYHFNPEGAYDDNGNLVPTMTDKIGGRTTTLGLTQGAQSSMAGMRPNAAGMVPGAPAPEGAGPQDAGQVLGRAAPGEGGAAATGTSTGTSPPPPPLAAPAPAPGQNNIHIGRPGIQNQRENEEMADYRSQLNSAAAQAVGVRNMLSESRILLKGFVPGRTAEYRLEAARWLKDGGAPEAVVDTIMRGKMSDAAAFEKLVTAAATQWMAAINKDNAKVRAVQEWQQFQKVYPRITTDPDAIKKMFDFMDYQAKLVDQEQKSYTKWRNYGKKSTDFPAFWNGIAIKASNDFFGNQQRQRSLGGTPRAPDVTPPPRPAGVDLGDLGGNP